MRVADRASSRNYLQYMNEAKTNFSTNMEQIASGNRFVDISEDVASGTKVLYSRVDLEKANTHLDNIAAITDELSVTEDNMMAVSDLLERAHTLVIKALNDPQGDSGRDAIVAEFDNIIKELLVYSNSKYGEKFIFGGSNASLLQPFALGDDGRVEYNGIPVDIIQQNAEGEYYYSDTSVTPAVDKVIPMDEEVYIDIGLGIKTTASSIDPDTAFLASHNGLDIFGFGIDATSGLSNNIYNTLSDIKEAISDIVDDETPENMEKLKDLEKHLNTVTDSYRANLTDVGSKVSYLESMEARHERNVDSLQIKIDNLMGIDEEAATISLSMSEYALKAVQQMGARLLPTSLMDFLS